MKKIIFLIFLIYSPFSFSSVTYGGVTFNVERHPEFPIDSLIGVTARCSSIVFDIFMGYDGSDNLFRNYFNYSPLYTFGFFSDAYSNFSNCVPLGFYEGSFSYSPTVGVGTDYYGFAGFYSQISLPNCPDGSPFSIAVPIPIRTSLKIYHPICMSDLKEWVYDGCDMGEPCNCPWVPTYSAVYYLIICPAFDSAGLSVSEQTTKKTNELLGESNSKLGVIAATNSTITSLLRQIKDSLLSLNSANFGIFGTNADSPDPSNKNNPNSSEFEPTFSSSSISVNDLEPMIYSSSLQCPADVSFTLVGSTHHLSYQPLCDFAEKLRPLVVAAARVSAAWIVIGAL